MKCLPHTQSPSESPSTSSEQRILPSGCHGAGDKGLLSKEGLRKERTSLKRASSNKDLDHPSPLLEAKQVWGQKPAKFEVWRIWT